MNYQSLLHNSKKASNSKIDELFSVILSNDGIKKQRKKPSHRLNNSNLSSNKSTMFDSKLARHNTDLKLNKTRKTDSTLNTTSHTATQFYTENTLYELNWTNNSFFSSKQDAKLDAQALSVDFMPWFTSTHGLTRPSSPDEKSEEIYYSILNESIKENMVSEVSSESLGNIEARLNTRILTNAKEETVETFRRDVKAHYVWSMKKCIFDYILKEEDEQTRLGVKINYRVMRSLYKEKDLKMETNPSKYLQTWRFLNLEPSSKAMVHD